MLTRTAPRDPSPLAPSSVLPWIGVVAVGVALGVGATVVPSLAMQWTVLSVALVLCPFVALIVGAPRTWLLAVIVLDTALPIDVNPGYRVEVGELGALGGLNISLTTISIAALYVIWACGLLTNVGPQLRPRFRASLPLTGYVAFVALSALTAYDVELALFELALLVQSYLVFLYIVSTVRTRRAVMFVVTMLLIGLIVQSGIMIEQRTTGHRFTLGSLLGGGGAPPPGSTVNWEPAETGRVSGLAGSPHAAASYISLLLAPALGLVLVRPGRWPTRLAAAAASLGAVALVFTFVRAGWIVSALAIGILCLLAWRRGLLSPTALFTSTAVVASVSLIFSDALFGRLLGDDQGSARARIPLNRLALRMIEDHPLLGIGANNFALVMQQYVTPDFGDVGEWLYVVHNGYLRIWTETGPGGLAAFLIFLAITIRAGWLCWRRGDRLLSTLALGFTLGIIGQALAMLSDPFNSRPQLQGLFLICAVVTALRAVPEEEEAEARPSMLGEGRTASEGERAAWTG